MGIDESGTFCTSPKLESMIPSNWSQQESDWKLIEFYEDGCLELYNLRDDISEENNLAAARPELTQELHQKLIDYREEMEALKPKPNPDWPW